MNWETPSNQQLSSDESQPSPSPQEPIEPQSVPSPQAPITAAACKLPGFNYFFRKALSTYENNFWTFLLISAIPFAVSFLLPHLFLKNLTGKPSLSSLILFIPIYLMVIIISIWSSLSLLYAVKERENGISVGGALAKGWSNLGSGIWISFLIFIIVAGGFILLIIPGVIFSIWFTLSLYVLVNENKKGMGALKRSKELISGYVTAFWGRTLLFGSILCIIFLLFSFIIRFTSAFLPALNYIQTIISLITAPLFAIFNFLVYENIKKAKDGGCIKSPREIKYILLALLLLLVPLGILASTVLVNLNSARQKAEDVSVESSMRQLQIAIEIYSSQSVNYSYSGINCLSSPDLTSACKNIKNYAGKEPIIKSSETNYCLYVKLPSGKYYCLASNYFGSIRETSIFPGGLGYCDGKTFNCPH